jgi:hypothetical protein
MSPIRGLTDRQAQFPELGQIRKGAPKPADGKRPGADLTFFRVTFDERETESAAIFMQHYGDKPTEIDVLLPFNVVDENLEAWRETYVAGGLVHRCDGERIWYEIDPKTGERLVRNGEPIKHCDGSAGCKPTGRLKIIVPQLHRLAFLTVLTTSLHDIMNLHRQLEALLQINGKLAGVPLKLRRRPIKISTPSGEGGKRARREKWLLSIEADPAWVKAKLLAMQAAALPGNGLGEDLPLLEAPDEPEEPEEDDGIMPVGNPVSATIPEPARHITKESEYWALVKKAGLGIQAGKDILKELKGNFDEAYRVVMDQHMGNDPAEQLPLGGATGTEDLPF